ncbi:(d)CMP kinase [Alphaproteobacteria bacterium]|nr:(d)CMP kinase [Alphaproteobacteria bacterium]
MIIAVDGPAASGKGTLARCLAAHFDFAYLDTGALYRGVGLHVLNANGDPTQDSDALEAAQKLDLSALEQAATMAALRTADVGIAASHVAAKPAVRASILQAQRDFAAAPPKGQAGAILDGRDIGTIVCPDAAHKLFVTASPEVRAQRRFLELKRDDERLQLASVLQDIQDRDARDTNRAIAPMKQAADAYLLDTSDLSIKEALVAALAFIAR